MKSSPIEKIVNAIREDRHRGASELAVACMTGLAEYAAAWQGSDTDRFRSDVLTLARKMQTARPSMEAVGNLVGRWCGEFDDLKDADLGTHLKAAISLAEALRQQSLEAVQKTVGYMVDRIEPGEVLFTHSVSSTIKQILKGVCGRQIRAVITESRPGNEGKLLARFLSDLAIATQYITDAQATIWMPTVSKVLIGADSVLADGAVVNKAGTSLIAMAAGHCQVPVYVCCETLKYSTKSAAEVVLEEMDSAELDLPLIPHVEPRNVYFDITPAKYITAWVSELGVSTRWT
jgi:translation initiation factor 2B subunit (eIF-2B alpha/beta/delta family)